MGVIAPGTLPSSGCEALSVSVATAAANPAITSATSKTAIGRDGRQSQPHRLRGAGSAARSAALTSSARRMSNGSFIVPPDFPATAQARARRAFSRPAQNSADRRRSRDNSPQARPAGSPPPARQPPTKQAPPANARPLDRRSPPTARRQAQSDPSQGGRDYPTPPRPDARNRSSNCARSPKARQPPAPSPSRTADDAPAPAQTSRPPDRTPHPARQSSCRRTP